MYCCLAVLLCYSMYREWSRRSWRVCTRVCRRRHENTTPRWRPREPKRHRSACLKQLIRNVSGVSSGYSCTLSNLWSLTQAFTATLLTYVCIQLVFIAQLMLHLAAPPFFSVNNPVYTKQLIRNVSGVSSGYSCTLSNLWSLTQAFT